MLRVNTANRAIDALLEKAKRKFAAITNQSAEEYLLGDASGRLHPLIQNDAGVASQDARYWLVRRDRDAQPEHLLWSGRGAFPVDPGTPVWVGYDYDGQRKILSMSTGGMLAQGANPNVNNTLDMRAHGFEVAKPLGVLQAKAIGTAANPSTKVVVTEELSYDDTNTVTSFTGKLIDLGPDIAGSGLQNLMTIWKLPDLTLVYLASTSKSMALPMTAADYQETVTNKPARAKSAGTYRTKNGQTAITEADKWWDTRQFMNEPPARNNWSATTNPDVTDDEDSGYGIGSVWVNTDPGNEASLICAKPDTGAALWLPMGGGSSITIDTDPTLAANSDTVVPSQKAIKTYVDAVAQGLSVKYSVIAATAAALPANTYANGSSGVGATITANAVGALTIDGQSIALNARVLVKDESSASHNGIYKCTTAGTGGVAFVLTRVTDMDTAAEIPGAFTFVENGTVNDGAGFVVADPGPFTVGTTAIPWTQFSGAGEISVTAPIVKTGNNLSHAASGISAAAHPYPVSVTTDLMGHITAITDGTAPLTSPLTTKGDVWGFSTVNARVPIGTNGFPLVADSTAALGLAWLSVIVLTQINDTGGNELIKFVATGSAVNELTLTNAAANSNPSIAATGGDTNIGIDILPKGTDPVNLDGAVVINESGADRDVRIESDTDANNFFSDGGSNNVGFGTGTPDASAKVEISSTTKGFLPPRIGTPEVDIASPANGLWVHNTGIQRPEFYETGYGWFPVGSLSPVMDIRMGALAGSSDATSLALVPVRSGKVWLPVEASTVLSANFIVRDPPASITHQKTPTGNTTNGNATVSNLSSTNGLVPGMSITGTGIAGGTTISSVGTTTLTLSANATATNTGVTLTCTLEASKVYDVFLYWTGTAVQYTMRKWTDDTTRASALLDTGNFWVLSASKGLRYIGTLRTNSSSHFEDNATKRWVWNYDHPIARSLFVADATNSWARTSTTIRQANGSTANQVEVLVGLASISIIDLTLIAYASTSGGGVLGAGIGEDSTTTFAAGQIGLSLQSLTSILAVEAKLIKSVPVGYHVYSWNEQGNTGGTFYGDNNTTLMVSGMTGFIMA